MDALPLLMRSVNARHPAARFIYFKKIRLPQRQRADAAATSAHLHAESHHS